MTDEAARAFDVALAGLFGAPAPCYGPNDPFTIAGKKIDAYNDADNDGKEAAFLRMFGLPEGCERNGYFSDAMDAVIFLACIQPFLGSRPWNREKHHYGWTAFPAYGDPQFSVAES